MRTFGQYKSHLRGQLSYPFASVSEGRTNYYGFYKEIHDARRLAKNYWHGMQSIKVTSKFEHFWG
jgi:hypothetical protein